jgi:hypothetical protein
MSVKMAGLKGEQAAESLGANILRKEVGCDVVDWSELAQDRLQWWVLMNSHELLGSIKCREFHY